jgi:hypothetical protein
MVMRPMDVVEAVEQPRDGGLAGARRADHGNGLAGRHLEADALEDRALRIVGEMHVLEADRRPVTASGFAPGLS